MRFRVLILVALLGCPALSAAADEPAKVVVVVAGDAEPALRDAARAVDQALGVAAGLVGPSDPGLRAAFYGEPAPAEDDGLGRARAARRKLGWGEKEDLPVLVRIGRMAGARCVVVVRRAQDGTLEAVVADVGAAAFYEGEITLPAAERAIERFVRARVKAAETRARAPALKPEKAATAEPSAPLPTVGHDPEPRSKTAPDNEERSWFRRHWAYVVGGALVAAVVVGFTVRSRHDAPATPVLRFIPGGNP